MQSKRVKKLFSSTIFLLVSSVAAAGEMGAQAVTVPWYYGEPSFSVGYFNAREGKAQHINIAGLIGNTYTVSKKSDDNCLLGLGYLFHGWNLDRYNLAYGIEAFYLFNTKVRGTVVQEDLFTNLSYRYKLTHIPIYAIARAS